MDGEDHTDRPNGNGPMENKIGSNSRALVYAAITRAATWNRNISGAETFVRSLFSE